MWPNHAEPADSPGRILVVDDDFGVQSVVAVTLRRAHCPDTGYRGRVAFHELVVITEEIRQLISDRKSVQEITRAAWKGGYRPLRYDGLNKVLLGLTTIEEIEENCSFELAE